MQGTLADFNLSNVWQRAIDLVMANWQLLAIIAGVFMLIPSLAMYLAFPELADMGAMIDTDPNADPEKVLAQMGDVYGNIAPYALIGTVVSMVGYSAMVTLIGESGSTVGEAIMRGIKSVLSLIAVMILFFIVYMLLTVLVFLPIALISALGTALAVIGGLLTVFAVVGVALFLVARFSVTLPVIVLEQNLNPVTAMIRSWQLTAPKKWPITGFWALLFLVYMVIAIVLGGLLGVGAALASGSVSALIMGLFNGLLGAVVSMIISGIGVALYQALIGQTAESVSDTFE